ncbi:MAG TPA: hypothetical protein V6C88_17355 [Chroococcidiopsis sp.]
MPTYSAIEIVNRHRSEITAAINQTLSQRSATGQVYEDGFPDPALLPFFPETSYLTLEAAFMRFKHKRPVLATIRGLDGDAPAQRETFDLSEQTVGNARITSAVIWTEADQLNLKKIADMRAAGGTGNVAAAAELEDVYKATPIRLTDRWANTLRMLCQRVSVLGKCLYTDPLTDIAVEIDYTSLIPAGNLPTPLLTTARWDQLATADGINDLKTHLNNVYANIRMFPPAIGFPGPVADNLLDQAKTKERVARYKMGITDGAAVDADAIARLPRPTLEEVAAVLMRELTASAQMSAQNISLVVTDAVYYSRDKAGNVNRAPYHPDGYYVFLWPNYIEAARFPVGTNNFAGGLAIVTDRSTYLPWWEKLAIDGAGIPIVPDPRYIAARNVYNTPIT